MRRTSASASCASCRASSCACASSFSSSPSSPSSASCFGAPHSHFPQLPRPPHDRFRHPPQQRAPPLPAPARWPKHVFARASWPSARPQHRRQLQLLRAPIWMLTLLLLLLLLLPLPPPSTLPPPSLPPSLRPPRTVPLLRPPSVLLRPSMAPLLLPPARRQPRVARVGGDRRRSFGRGSSDRAGSSRSG